MSSWFGSSSSSSSSSPSLPSSPLPPSSPPDFDLTPPTFTQTSSSTSSSERPKLPQGRVDPNHLYDYINITEPGSGNYSMISPMESCIVKSAISGVMGGGMGFLLGLFMSSTDPTWVTDPTGQIRDMRARDQIRHSMKHMWTRSSGMAKNFASIGAVYSAVECVIEKERGTHDMFNTVAAGCITGAGLAWRAGPQAMVLGCGGFAAFSAAIEAFMTRDSA